MCTLAMMVGEFNFGEVFIPDGVEKGTPTIQIAFVLFLLLVAIIIMNLLIGLAIRLFDFDSLILILLVSS